MAPLVQIVVRGSSLVGLDAAGGLWTTTDSTAAGEIRWREVRQEFHSREAQLDAWADIQRTVPA